MRYISIIIRNRPLLLLALLLLAAVNGCKKQDPIPKAADEKATVILDWYKLQLKILLHANPATNNNVNINNFGYTGVALYEAVRNGIKGSVSLSGKLYQMPSMPSHDASSTYLWSEAANAALAAMVRSMFVGLTDANKASIDSLEQAYNVRLGAMTDPASFERSQSYGRAVAAAVFNWSKSDNFIISAVGYTLPVFPGAWEPTPPAFAAPASPFVKDARPFLAANLTAFAPPLPFPYSEEPASSFYQMAKAVYDASLKLTDEQKTMASFWADVGISQGYTPLGHIMSIVTQEVENQQVDLARAATIYGKSGIAVRDGLITLWKMKYFHNIIRPVTYIRRHIDANWSPFLVTPPHPEYPSAHSYITNGMLQVLIREFGDSHAFIDNTYNFLGYMPRYYSSLSAVGDEVSISRFYGGIHYIPALSIGLQLGKKIGDQVADLDLTTGGTKINH